MKRLLLVLIAFAVSNDHISAGVVVSASDVPSDTVKFLCRKSDLVIVATITGLIFSAGSAPIDPKAFYPRPYTFVASVDAVLFGPAPKQNQIRAAIARIERGADPLSIKPGKYILFLKRSTRVEGLWKGADPLFSAWIYDAGLAAALGQKLDYLVQDQ